jgi:iron(III) transport system substrate-binding protein
VSEVFREKHGFGVEWTSLSSSDMIPRVLAEQRTKRFAADVGMFGFGSAYLEFKPRGYLVPILAPSTFEERVWIQHPAEAKPKDRDWFYIEFALHPGFLLSNHLVPRGEEPKSYKDLLNPKWTGKIVLQSPALPGSGSGWFLSSYKKLGLDYLRALAKQVVLVRTVADVPTGVARGQYAIGLAPSTSITPRLLKEGAPVKLVRPREGSYVTVKGLAAFANAPHPNAAKTFLNWFFSREGQFIVSKNNLTISLRKDVPQDYLQPEFRYVEGEPYMTPDLEDFSIEGQRAIYALAKQIFEEGK